MPRKRESQKYFSFHECHLPPEQTTPHTIECNRVRKFILNFTTVRMGDVRAQRIYKSYAALCAEKYRQYRHYPMRIHPFSTVRIWLEFCFFITILTSNTLVSLHFSQKDPLNCYDSDEITMYILDFLYLVNIVAMFFTGYVAGDTSRFVVLDLKKICLRYCMTWFPIDVMSSLCFLPCVLHSVNLYTHLMLVSTKLLRVPCMIIYMNNVMTVLEIEKFWKIVNQIFVLIISYLTWNVYFQFAVEYMVEGTTTPVSPRSCSWITIGKLWNDTNAVRYIYAMDRAVGMLRRNANMNFMDENTCFEIFYMVFWFIAKLLVVHCALIYIVAFIGAESAKAKYFIMTKQVENFMNQRKFPPRIKKKILKFYAIRFRSSYIAESKMLSCVTGQLREDILMHTGRQLVREIQFLKQLPRSLHLQLCMELRIVIFIAGDIVFKINTVGDCLYFIDKGTVAIYSESGSEICHLEDGDFFGEIALVMKHGFRTASAVAVTNCELFRLDKKDFDSSIALYPTVYDSIKKVAINRFEKTYILDEHHKAELRMRGDYKADLEMEYEDK